MSFSELQYTPQCNFSSAYTKCVRYMRRIFKFEQMDFQFASWQMLYLFIAPQKLLKIFRARKQTKSQYARDDPAFFGTFIKFIFFVIFIDCIGIGLLMATVLWYIANTFLKSKNDVQDIEWGFSFDMHLNAFFSSLFFYNGLISHDWFLSILLGNTFWLGASFYYVYITFLGYNSMQILNHTRVFLAPIPWFIFIYIISLFMKFNITHSLMNFYKYRVL
ncbi:hypothetical protein NQ317_017665 [Molorchus minor]|uniref:Uncharacterized protein n=1 Tax=Molorchus minor TaxID=1323400 RepID=A0ABQ9JWI9_9CUCU|nr:hypothetical protein NQ317_017665 [Molorchus minor]